MKTFKQGNALQPKVYIGLTTDKCKRGQVFKRLCNCNHGIKLEKIIGILVNMVIIF